jgi:hypothetical protein
MHVRVPLQPRVRRVEGVELGNREEATHREHGVERDRGVSLAEDEAIPLRPVGVAGIDVHLIEVERDENVGRRERSTEMSGSRVVDGLYDQFACLDTRAPEIVEGGAEFGCGHGHDSSITAMP